MKLLREYIRILLKEQPDLGNVVFGEDEPDTEYEAELYKFFSDHFDGIDRRSNLGSDPTLIDNLEAYMSDPRYRDTFRPYVGPAFRGVVMDVRDLIPILLTGDWEVRPDSNNIDDLLKKKNKKGFSGHDVNYAYRPNAFGNHSLLSHWSKDINVAYGFTSTVYAAKALRNIELPMQVVMYAQPGQTFLDAAGLYNLPGGGDRALEFAGFSDEKEVIGMGVIDVGRVMIKKGDGW
ncbi:MAG: hypothetical protein VXU48_04115 [Verrucomicrobiota bacterium]|nr:hypothetical protein [Verrucomicrobiota bacterium]